MRLSSKLSYTVWRWMSLQGSRWVLALWSAPGDNVCGWTPREPAVQAAPTQPSGSRFILRRAHSPVLRACFLQSSFHPKPRGGLGSAGRRQEQELRRNGRGKEAADGRSIRDSGKSNFLGLAKEVAGRGGGVTGQRTGRGSAPPRTKPGVETQHPHLGAFTLVSDLAPSPEPRKSSG